MSPETPEVRLVVYGSTYDEIDGAMRQRLHDFVGWPKMPLPYFRIDWTAKPIMTVAGEVLSYEATATVALDFEAWRKLPPGQRL